MPLAFLAAGLAVAYGPMLRSGFARMQVDPSDTRLENWLLEHDWRWATGWSWDADLWSPPVFWPQAGTVAYSDALVTAMPFYGVFRAVGAGPDTALQLFMIFASILNFGAFFGLLRRPLGLSAVASSFGAFLFAYGSVRNVQIGHQQLILHVFSVGALYACVRLWGSEPAEGPARAAWWGALAAAGVAQAWAAFYLAWFLALALACACLWAVGSRRMRARVLDRWRFDAVCLVSAGALGVAALWPLASHYVAAAHVVGVRKFDEIVPILPAPAAFLNMGDASWLYGRTAPWDLFRSLAPLEPEKRLGLGLVTSLLVVSGLVLRRRDPGVRVMILTAATLAILTIRLAGGQTAWRVVYSWFPAASAIRAVPRVALILLPAASIGLAFAAEHLVTRGRAALTATLGILVVLEQGQSMPSYDKRAAREQVEHIARAMPSGCRAFFYSPLDNRGHPPWETQVDAMWAAMEIGIPTVNGYSGNFPPDWLPLLDHSIQKERPDDARRLQEALKTWLDSHGTTTRGICWVKLPQPER